MAKHTAKEPIDPRLDDSTIDENIPWPNVNRDMIRVLNTNTWMYYGGLAFFVTMVLISAAIFYNMTTKGLGLLGENNAVFWGLDIPAFIFWIGLSHAGTFLSAVLFYARSNWRRSIYRYAELMTLFSLLNVFMILTIHLGRPWRFWFGMPVPFNGRFLWPSYRSPLAWDLIAITTYTTGSALFLYLGMVPDFAGLRDHVGGWRNKVFKVASLGWRGTDKEWKFLVQAYSLIGAMIIPLMASVHSLVAWDFVNTMVPGFHNTMFAPFFVAGALYSGIAGVIMLVIPIRRMFHLEDYIRISHFDKLGRLMLLLAFVWVYFQSIEAWGAWYKQDSFETFAFLAKAIGPWAPWYWFMIAVCGVMPMALFSRKVRTNLPVMLGGSILINIGMFIERFLIIVPGESITHLPSTWKYYVPTVHEVFIYIILPLSLFGTLFMLSLKIVPHLSLYEIKEILTVPMRPAVETPEAIPKSRAHDIKAEIEVDSETELFSDVDDIIDEKKEEGEEDG